MMQTIIKKVSFLTLVMAGIIFGGYVTFAQEYQPTINPKDFSSHIEGNPYFNLPVGTVVTFEEQTEDGMETVRIEILDETVKVNGIETRVYWDRVYVDGELVEDTRDYIAQHKNGDVWYFGEDVNNYEDGKLTDHHGTWLYGEHNAQPGIWIKANPRVDEVYRQEYLAGEAEDMVEVISLDATVSANGKTYTGCLQTFDYTPLDEEAQEHKFYCKDTGTLVSTKHLVENEQAFLVSVSRPNGNSVMLKQTNDTDEYQNLDDKEAFDDDLDEDDEKSDEDEEEKEFDEEWLFAIIGLIVGLLVGAGAHHFLAQKKEQ